MSLPEDKAVSVDAYNGGPVKDEMPRCWRCGRLLAEIVTRYWRIRCSRCKALNQN
jgi:ribosomal protein S27AE